LVTFRTCSSLPVSPMNRGWNCLMYSFILGALSRRGSTVMSTGCRIGPAFQLLSRASTTTVILLSSFGQMSGQKVKPK
jgi:hypothetical protein